ncbi:MAG: amidase [Alphaproteobacteria bacterium]
MGWNEATASAVAAAVRAGKATARQVADDAIAAIAAREPTLHAFVNFDPKLARRAAKDADAIAPKGPLAGVTVGVKDIIDAKGWPTECNSGIYKGHLPDRDAAAVALLRRAGATIVGKTVTTEYAFSHPGPTVNPYNPKHTPGGSSSGSAAAVAARLVHVALGTQTGGSVIRPGAYCGVFSLKPSFGLVPREGVKPLSESLDTVGWYARSVEDLALVLSVFQHHRAPAVGTRLRIALCEQPPWRAASRPVKQAMARAAKGLEAAGHRVVSFGQERRLEPLHAAQETLMILDGARALRYERIAYPELLSERLRERISGGDKVKPDAERAVRHLADQARAAFDGILGRWDAVLVPAAPGEAPATLESTGDPVFNRIWTLLGVPCVGFPVGRGPNGLPLGLQLVTRRGDDARLLAVAARVAEDLGATA